MTSYESIEQMQDKVSNYIKEKKGRRVEVNIMKRIHHQRDPFSGFAVRDQLQKLCEACDWIEKERLETLNK